MKYIFGVIGFLVMTTTTYADTLYQADVGGYSSTVGVGFGAGINPGVNNPYSSSADVNVYSNYSGLAPANSNYDSFAYPRSSGCCGCNRCNNCDNGYANQNY